MIHSTGSLFYSDASARALPGRMHFYKLPVYSSNGQAKPAHFKIFAPQKYLYAACAAARPCRADNPAGNSPQHNISPHPRRRKVRAAPLPPDVESYTRSLASPFPTDPAYPQGVCGIRKAAKPLTAAQSLGFGGDPCFTKYPPSPNIYIRFPRCGPFGPANCRPAAGRKSPPSAPRPPASPG